ncbi:hypothetical protein COCMIDRAFT_110054 [Bipolaris oryzae ATCC 44560]|uniref:Major facilitator superfamily (MFS) profile domain-containing protein n=1 Tax=Bipolaris oryzae ATCC 44560 TaxID=930090 RepID=W6YWQ0_COCMI|nr:uncharacterized protein COCMIDRAFT_110054 [Bipolaris oryzae ATCC 44560]EUC39954.1 hypothetical protein COCMIDRAFT_110054 [Bipolaris oryzae ATCC 44560]
MKDSETSPTRNLVTWDSDHDPENPRNWKSYKKWVVLSVVSFIAFISPLASSMIAPAISLINKSLKNDSETLSVLVVTFFILGYVVGSLFFGRLSEVYGRRPAIILLLSTFIFSIWQLGCALSTSIQMQMAFRFLAGFGGSGCLSIGGGIISDIFDRDDRGLALTIFAIGPLLGPIVGPIVGAYLGEGLGWRAIYYFMFITSMISIVVTFFSVKESNAEIILQRKSEQLQKINPTLVPRSEADQSHSKLSFYELILPVVRPWKLLFRSPVSAILCLYMAYVYGLLYLLFTTISSVFTSKYGWSISQSSLVYISIGVGFFIGLAVHGVLSAALLKKSLRANNDIFEPEMRLEVCKILGFLVPMTFFWYGWAADKGVHWAISVVGLLPFGIGLVGIFLPIQSYMIEAFPQVSASATAILVSSRNVVGTFLPVVAPDMYQKLGLGWGNSLLGFLSIVAIPFIWVITRNGKALRAKYPIKL